MIIFREPQEVTTWFLVFHPDSLLWWMRFVPGRWKHVSAFAFADRAKVWVFYDVSLAGTKVMVLPEGKAALERLAEWTAHCHILKFTCRETSRARPHIVFSCAGAMKHLLGLSGGAVRADTLWRDLLRQGAEIVHDGTQRRVEPCAASCGDPGGFDAAGSHGPAAAGGGAAAAVS